MPRQLRNLSSPQFISKFVPHLTRMRISLVFSVFLWLSVTGCQNYIPGSIPDNPSSSNNNQGKSSSGHVNSHGQNQQNTNPSNHTNNNSNPNSNPNGSNNNGGSNNNNGNNTNSSSNNTNNGSNNNGGSNNNNNGGSNNNNGNHTSHANGKESLPWSGPQGEPLPPQALGSDGTLSSSFVCKNGQAYAVPTTVCPHQKGTCVSGTILCANKITLGQGRFQINGQDMFLRGVVYNPVPACKPHQHDFTDEPSIYSRDFPVLQQLGHNIALRITRPITDRNFLHEAHRHGLFLVAAFPVRWATDFQKDCGTLQTEFREQLKFYQHHPAIVAYNIGEQIAVHILNSTLSQKEQRIKDWFVCLNKLAGEVKQIEGALARPVSTISAIHDNEVIGQSAYQANEATLSNLDFYMFNVYLDTQIRSWLRTSMRKQWTKPVVVASLGMDACAYDSSTQQCQEDQVSQKRAILTLVRDLQAAHEEDATTRVAGGFVMGYSDELWMGEPYEDICQRNSVGYAHPRFFDGSYNPEWFGLVDIHSVPQTPQPRLAWTALQEFWSQQNPWPAGTPNVRIQSHTTGATIDKRIIAWGDFSGFAKQPGQFWAAVFILIRPYLGSDHYPMQPITLGGGFGVQEWMMPVQVGRDQDKGQKFELIPAYTTDPATYQKMVQPDYYFTSKPDGLILLKSQAILVTRKP